MHKIIFSTIIFLSVVCSCLVYAQNKICPVCGEKNVPALAMNCPNCGAPFYGNRLHSQSASMASLRIKLLYTGTDIKNLPPYAKLYINGVYKGNIDLIEKQQPSKDSFQVWSNGLGKDFFAYYETVVKDLQEGVMKIEVEMKFRRMYGFARSFRRVIYPYVSLKSGEETLLEHRFSGVSSFNKKSTEKFDTPPKKPAAPNIKIKGASGTVAVNIPLF